MRLLELAITLDPKVEFCKLETSQSGADKADPFVDMAKCETWLGSVLVRNDEALGVAVELIGVLYGAELVPGKLKRRREPSEEQCVCEEHAPGGYSPCGETGCG